MTLAVAEAVSPNKQDQTSSLKRQDSSNTGEDLVLLYQTRRCYFVQKISIFSSLPLVTFFSSVILSSYILSGNILFDGLLSWTYRIYTCTAMIYTLERHPQETYQDFIKLYVNYCLEV